MRRKHGSICPGMKARDDLLRRVCAPLRVRTKGLKDDRRVRRKARDALHDFGKRQLVGPDETHATLKSRESGFELWTHEPADSAGPGHHEDLTRLWEDPQDVVYQRRVVVDDRDCCLVVAKRRAAEVPLIHRAEQERRGWEKLPPMFPREQSGWTADGHDEIRRRTIGVDRIDVVDDGRFRRADEPGGAHHDLNDVHWGLRTLIQPDAEDGGESIQG